MRHYLLSVLLLVVLVSCKHELKVVFPNTVKPEIAQYILNQEYIVVIYVDSSECTPCSLNHLMLWKNHITMLEENNTGILLIIRNSDEQLISNTLKSIDISFPFIIDKGGKFKASNEIFKFIDGNTFVVDKKRNAIFTESPIKNERTWKMFMKKTK
jgi:hypothetical protein